MDRSVRMASSFLKFLIEGICQVRCADIVANPYRKGLEEMNAKNFNKEMPYGHGASATVPGDKMLLSHIEERLSQQLRRTSENLEWLSSNMHPYFFITMKEEEEAILHLDERLDDVPKEKKVTLVDQEKKLILAQLDLPGSIYESLRTLQERDISYAEMGHSYNFLPSIDKYLEIQRFEFDRRGHEEIAEAGPARIPGWIKASVQGVLRLSYPDFDLKEFESSLRLLWLNHGSYVRI